MENKLDFIACNIDCYTLKKEIQVFKDGKKIESIQCKNIDNLTKILYNICKEKEIKNIYLASGSKEFAKRLREEILEEEFKEFYKNNISVNII